MNFNDAKKLALEYLNPDAEKPVDKKLALFEDSTVETSFGWCFFYNSYAYVHDMDERKMIISSPIFVDKDLNLIFRTGTRLSYEEYVEIYEKTRGDLEAFNKLALLV